MYKQNIKISVADEEIELSINSEEEEEIIREAAKLINNELKQIEHPVTETRKTLVFAFLNYVLKTISNNRELDNTISAIEQFSTGVDNYIKNIDKKL